MTVVTENSAGEGSCAALRRVTVCEHSCRAQQGLLPGNLPEGWRRWGLGPRTERRSG